MEYDDDEDDLDTGDRCREDDVPVYVETVPAGDDQHGQDDSHDSQTVYMTPLFSSTMTRQAGSHVILAQVENLQKKELRTLSEKMEWTWFVFKQA